jgi:tetratricopeptide (TPR) repeat protein
MEELGAPNRAILYEKKAIAIAGNSDDAIKYQLHLGHILLSDKIKRPDEAMLIAENILSISPSSAPALYLKSYSYFHKNQYTESLASIQKTIEFEPSNSGYYFFRAIVYEKLKNWNSMESDLKKTIELAPTYPVPYNYLGFLLAEKNERIEEALALIQKAVDLEPDNAAYQDSLGWAFFRKGDIENALFHLHLAKQIMEYREQEDGVVLDHLGDVYSAKEEIVKAREFWKKALALTKDSDSKVKLQDKIQNSIVTKR